MEGLQEAKTVPRFNGRHAQPESYNHPLDGETLNILKIMSHDLRGSLISIMATLKLLSRGYYGRMDEGVENQVEELLGRVAQLIGMSEECLGRALSGDGHLDIRQEVLDLRKDVIHPVLEELSSEIKDHQMRIDNRLERVPAVKSPLRQTGSG
jgi:K+-sensing histidine kinase KdpD